MFSKIMAYCYQSLECLHLGLLHAISVPIDLRRIYPLYHIQQLWTQYMCIISLELLAAMRHKLLSV